VRAGRTQIPMQRSPLCSGGSVGACRPSGWKWSGDRATLGAGSFRTRSSPSTRWTPRSCRPRAEMFGQIYRGHEGLRRYISEFAAAFEAPSFEVEDLIDAGACVVEIVQVSARGRHSGAEVRRRIASVYSLRAGVVFKHVIYLDRAEALAAAGLPLRPTRQPRSGTTETAYGGRSLPDARDAPPPPADHHATRRARRRGDARDDPGRGL
jgi:ketosteroid isomerase-like protein